MINKHAQKLGRESWIKNPKTKEQMSKLGKLGWTQERREKQKLVMKLAREARLKKYATNKQKNEGEKPE